MMKLLMLALFDVMFYNRGNKGRRIMAAFGGWRLTRSGVVFIVGILVLGGLVTGGVFLVKNHGEAVRHDQAVKIAEQNLKDQSKTGTQPTDTASSDGSNGSNTTNNADKTSTAGTNTATTTTTASNANGSNASQLPVTGIDDFQVLGTSTVLALLAFSVVSYLLSRRATSEV
jgi:hypothetical protein